MWLGPCIRALALEGTASAVTVTIMSHGNIIVTRETPVTFKIQLVEIIVSTEARVVKTTEAATSVASNVATAMHEL